MDVVALFIKRGESLFGSAFFLLNSRQRGQNLRREE
jgi:hypothetical protein